MGRMIRSANTSGKRPAENPQQREGQAVGADVVIFPVRAKRLQRTGVAFLGAPFQGDGAVAVDPVGLAEQRAFPLRGVLQQVPPGDGAVMIALEPAIINPTAHGLIEGGDQPVGHRDAGQQGQIGLRRREGEVDLIGVAPARDLVAAAQDQSVGGPRGRMGPRISLSGGASTNPLSRCSLRS